MNISHSSDQALPPAHTPNSRLERKARILMSRQGTRPLRNQQRRIIDRYLSAIAKRPQIKKT